MKEDILQKLYKNEQYLDYLRHHPKWYYYLDADPKNFDAFEKVIKKELKMTTYDQLEKMKRQVNFASAFIKYISK
jgi:hypothetical protein